MALVNLSSPLLWPGIHGDRDNSPNVSGVGTVDAAGEYASVIMCAPFDMAISHVPAIYTASGTTVCDVRIETVDSSGFPSGTLWATNTNGSTGTLTTNVVNNTALTATANISKGQIFCVKQAFVSGTSFAPWRVNGYFHPTRVSLPYVVFNLGSPSKSIMTFSHCMALGSSATSFYHVPGLALVSAVGGGTFNNTNSARRGLRFTLPFNCRCVGMVIAPEASTGDYNIILMDDAGNELSSSSTAFDGDHNAISASGLVHQYFDNTVTLTAGTTYRAVVEPTSATNTTVKTLTVPSADYISSTPLGTAGHYTTYASGSWTDSATTETPLIDLIIDQIDDGAGGGGGGTGESFAAYVA